MLALPHLLFREFVAALALIAFIMVIALLFDAPLGDPANPGMSPNPAKAPWYFLGFQELLLHFDPIFAVVVIPPRGGDRSLVPCRTFATDKDSSGILMMSRVGRRMGRDAAIAAAVATPVLIVADEYVVGLSPDGSRRSPVVTNGVGARRVIAARLPALPLADQAETRRVEQRDDPDDFRSFRRGVRDLDV